MASGLVATTFDICDPVVGNEVIDWSDNGFIAMGTRQSILISELELQTTSSTSIPLKTEYIRYESEKCFHENKVREYVQHEKEKLTSKTEILHPNFLAYKLKLSDAYGTCNTTTDAVLVSFSASNSTLSDGSILAAINSWNEIDLFVQSHPGKAWFKVTFASLDYEAIPTSIQTELQEIINKKMKDLQPELFEANMKEFTTITWSNIYTENDEHYVKLVGINKCNIMCTWKILLPFYKKEQIELIAAKCLNHSGVAKCIMMVDKHSEDKKATGTSVCIGYMDGIVIFVDGDKTEYLWSEDDHLSVTSISVDYNKESKHSIVACVKGHVMLFIVIKNGAVEEYCINRGTLDTPLKTVKFIKINSYLALSENGGLASYTLTKSDNAITCETKILKEETFPTIPVTHHSMALSPNQAFVAILTSFQKITSNTQVLNDTSLNIIPFSSPTETFALLNGLENLRNFDDVLHLTCFYLSHQVHFPTEFYKKFTKPPTMSDKGLPIFWFLYYLNTLTKQELGLNKDITLDYIEKVTVAKQMIHILDKINLDGITNDTMMVPISGMLDWLAQNGSLLTKDAIDAMTTLRRNPRIKSYVSKEEICNINGTRLEFSPCGTKAIDCDGSEWERCCLTFIPIQFHKVKKCKYSMKCCLVKSAQYSDFVNQLLDGISPYTLLKML